jgi:hypothetical protein
MIIIVGTVISVSLDDRALGIISLGVAEAKSC